MRAGILAVLIGLGASAPALAQVGTIGGRLINLPTNLTLGPSTFQVLFTHRFTQTVDEAGGKDLFGFDSAADIGLGVALGLGRSTDVELVRSSFYKEWEAACRWTLARQSDAMPVGVGLRVGADYRGASGLTDRWSGFMQLVATRRFAGTLDVFLVPMFASDTPTLRNAFNVGVGASYHLPKNWDVEAEIVPENGDARDGQLAWAVAINKRLAGHAFLIYLGNSRATTVDMMVGSDFSGGFRSGDVRIGFNLLRRFPE
jgi:hypothetical protein